VSTNTTIGFRALGEADAVVLHRVEELAPATSKPVRNLRGKATGEDARVLPLLYILATALYEVVGKVFAKALPGGSVGVGEPGEVGSEEREKVVKRGIVARVRRGGEEDEVTLSVVG
jgi:hypothetical protein